jgi:hypothetical protein
MVFFLWAEHSLMLERVSSFINTIFVMNRCNDCCADAYVYILRGRVYVSWMWERWELTSGFPKGRVRQAVIVDVFM